jgi:hypothetical protein
MRVRIAREDRTNEVEAAVDIPGDEELLGGAPLELDPVWVNCSFQGAQVRLGGLNRLAGVRERVGQSFLPEVGRWRRRRLEEPARALVRALVSQPIIARTGLGEEDPSLVGDAGDCVLEEFVEALPAMGVHFDIAGCVTAVAANVGGEGF